MFQRIFDIGISVLALTLVLPVMIFISLILKFTGEGEIFYKQRRIGKNMSPFYLYKFATMKKNSPFIGARTITTKNDSRILPFGKFLRKTKLNELPQLINIIFGDMSLIGPRPLTEENFSIYNKEVQLTITQVRPGLSGVGSIIFRDEEAILVGNGIDSFEVYKEIISPYKGEVEKWYITNQSLLIYFKLILVTIFVVIFPHSNLVWHFFSGLPHPPKDLEKFLKF